MAVTPSVLNWNLIKKCMKITFYSKIQIKWTRLRSTNIFSIVTKNFSELSSLVKKLVGGQEYMGKEKIRVIIDYHLPLRACDTLP